MKGIKILFLILVVFSPRALLHAQPRYQCAGVLKEAAAINNVDLPPTVSESVTIRQIDQKVTALLAKIKQFGCDRTGQTESVKELGKLKNSVQCEKLDADYQRVIGPVNESNMFRIARVNEIRSGISDVQKAGKFWDHYEELGGGNKNVGRVFLKENIIVGFTLKRGVDRINYAVDGDCKVTYVGKSRLQNEVPSPSMYASPETCANKRNWEESFGRMPKKERSEDLAIKTEACEEIDGYMFEGKCKCNNSAINDLTSEKFAEMAVNSIDPWAHPACNVRGDPKKLANKLITESNGVVWNVGKPMIRELKQLCEQNADLLRSRVKTARGGEGNSGPRTAGATSPGQ